MIVHVDDICYGGTEDFKSQVIIKLKKKIEFGQQAKLEFKYLGMKIKEHHDCITMDQMNYIEKKLEEVGNKDKRRDKEEILDEEDQTQYRSGLGKLNWLAQQTWPELSFQVSKFGIKMQQANGDDLVELNKTIKNAKKKESWVTLDQLKGNKWDLKVFCDASFGNVMNGRTQVGYYIRISNI